MSEVLLTSADVVKPGDPLRITLCVGGIPAILPDGDLRNAIDTTMSFRTSKVDFLTLRSSVSICNYYDIFGVVQEETSVGLLSAQVANALDDLPFVTNTTVDEVGIERFSPGDILPDVEPEGAVVAASLAIVVLAGLIVFLKVA